MGIFWKINYYFCCECSVENIYNNVFYEIQDGRELWQKRGQVDFMDRKKRIWSNEIALEDLFQGEMNLNISRVYVHLISNRCSQISSHMLLYLNVCI